MKKGDYYLIRLRGKPAIVRILFSNKKDKPLHMHVETMLVFIDHRVVRHQISTKVEQDKLNYKLSYKNKKEVFSDGKTFLEYTYPEFML